MIRLYRGHIYAGLAVALTLLGFIAGIQVFYMGGVTGFAEFALLMIWMFTSIAALVFAALAYVNWVPKWERDEKRTGHVLGDPKEREKV